AQGPRATGDGLPRARESPSSATAPCARGNYHSHSAGAGCPTPACPTQAAARVGRADERLLPQTLVSSAAPWQSRHSSSEASWAGETLGLHAFVIGPPAAFRHDPVDDLVGVSDVAGLAMDAV